jgi:hypothetical protein
MTDNNSGDNDNIVYLNERIKYMVDPVPMVCEVAGRMLSDVVIVGTGKDGSIKMMTTVEDIPDIVWYLETAKHSLLSGGLEEPDD